MSRKNRKVREEEEIPCIVFLSTNETESEERAEIKEDKQLAYISEYADAHGLVPVRIVRRGCMGQKVCNDMFLKCIDRMKTGRARAILVANMRLVSSSESDAYHKVGLVVQNGFRVFSVDDKGELKLGLTGF
ncbi:MAG: resolvase [Agathobacter sp.]